MLGLQWMGLFVPFIVPKVWRPSDLRGCECCKALLTTVPMVLG